jgi:methyl-accepting chemotaxis protein
MFRSISLKSKLLMLCFTLASVSLVVGLAGYFGLQRVSRVYDHIADVNLPNTRTSGEMLGEFRRIRVLLRTLGLPGITRQVADQAVADAKLEIEKFEKSAKHYTEIDYAPGVSFGPGEKERYDAVMAAWATFKAIGGRVFAHYEAGTVADREKMLQIFFKDCPDAAKVFTVAIMELMDFHEKESDLWQAQAKSAEKQAQGFMIALIVGAFVFAMVVGAFFANAVSRSITLVSERLQEGATKVGVAATQIASASEQLSASATEQAAALQQTTASVDETSAMITKNAENAQKSSTVAASSQAAVTQGKQAVDEMVRSIEEISRSNGEIMKQIEQSNQEISEIVKVIGEIGNKTKVINDIVFQTKLLSFNASVEAARAGEHGKGFAVVAEEVGNLAQMSGNSSKEISAMLDGSIQKVEQIVNNTKSRVEALMLSGRDKVEAGTATARRCGEVLEEIVRNVSEVGVLVTEIATASQEQATGVQEITKAMNQLDQVGQQNHAASQQASSAANDLQEQVVELRGMVDGLNETIHGVGSNGAPAPSSHSPRTRSASSGSNVVALRAKAPATPARTASYRKAAGESFPSKDDPRFSDV